MIASYIALAAIIAFVLRMAARHSRGTEGAGDNSKPASTFRYYVGSFLAGALFANSIPHFIHGVSGEYFPAPFVHNLGRGVGTNIANVVWGLINFGAGYFYARDFENLRSKCQFRLAASVGFLCTSIFLSWVFSRIKSL